MGRVSIRIDCLGAGGEGLGRLDGRVVFVAGVAPHELVEVELYAEKERLSRGRLIRVIEPSVWRRELPCSQASHCGGCSWGFLDVQAQRVAKERIFRETMERVGGFLPGEFLIRPLLSAPPDWGYRQRVTLHRKGKQLGYRKRASHELVEFDRCPLLDPRLESAVHQLQESLSELGGASGIQDVALASDEKRVGVAFIVDADRKGSGDWLEKLVRKTKFSGAVLVAPQGIIRTVGKPILSYVAPLAPGVTMYGRAGLFAQANRSANVLLVQEAIRLIQPLAEEEILELFSGTGNFTFAMARNNARITTIESCGDALELARRTVRESGMNRVRSIVGDALHTAGMLAKEGKTFSSILLDPPRTGVKGIGALADRLQVRKVVYVSCEPATLARDLGELKRFGFLPLEAVLVDMFPQTFHIEAVVSLVRK